MKDGFLVSVESPEYFMSIDEIWPDGDAPKNPTTEDVLKIMRDYCKGNIYHLIRDWALDKELTVIVDGREV